MTLQLANVVCVCVCLLVGGWLSGGGSWYILAPHETLLTHFSRDLHLCAASEARLNCDGPAAGIGCEWHC